MTRKLTFKLIGAAAIVAVVGVVWQVLDPDIAACKRMAKKGFLSVPDSREYRFLGKVNEEDTAICRGGEKAVKFRNTPWLDWSNYWATGDESSKSGEIEALIPIVRHIKKNGRGIDGALLDLEYQRVELIKFNLFDNTTFEAYVRGRGTFDGRALKIWPEMRLPEGHPNFSEVGGSDEQLCKGALIRHRTLTGICNDTQNPIMGSTGQLFARNVQFEETSPIGSDLPWVRDRHGDRISLLTPDPQVISRKLFSRAQSQPNRCNGGKGLADGSVDAHCDYKKAPFFNVLAAYWIQFMTHDWFSHLVEARNDPQLMAVGCTHQKLDNIERRLTPAETEQLGCRPADRMDRALMVNEPTPGSFEIGDRSFQSRAYKITRNNVTAWWDASQIYGYDERSLGRVKRDPADRARLLMIPVDGRSGEGDGYGYLPTFTTCQNADASCNADPINDEWEGQEAVAFPDNWTIGLSFLHNLFVREHNIFVEAFRAQTELTPEDDSGLRNPDHPGEISYQDVTPDELFQVARLVVAAEIAKIHTIEWTTQLLYDEPLYIGMNSNWNGLVQDHPLIEKALDRAVKIMARSEKGPVATSWFSVFASGPGIIGLSTTNHFGSPFNFPEEFVTVYRLHALVPDLLEYRTLDENPDVIRKKIPVVATFRGKATEVMREHGLTNWALSLGRQRLGLLVLQNHPQFLQSLKMPVRLNNTETKTLDVVALDILRDRERGIPRFNEFRRQYGLRQLTSFDDFIDQHLAQDSTVRADQEELVRLLREVYGTHICDISKQISRAQMVADKDGKKHFPTDCLGHKDGTEVDNVEDLDTVVGWLAETTRPHGFAISETQFQVFILNASRRLYSDRFFTSSFRPEFYGSFGLAWVNDNGPDGEVLEAGSPNGHEQPVSPLKRILLRAMPELKDELAGVVNVFDPWARDRGKYYSLSWEPRPGAAEDEAFPSN